jgi:hypothetical protein
MHRTLQDLYKPTDTPMSSLPARVPVPGRKRPDIIEYR